MADDNNKEVAIRKRQQIDSSNKTMFLFVAAAAFIVGATLVVSMFLIQHIVFNFKVIGAKNTTISNIESNLESAKELESDLRVLETNEALLSVRSKEENSALQSILDALPTEPNVEALGASLEKRFVGSVSELNLTDLTPLSSDEADGDDRFIGFSMSVSSDSLDGMKELLTKFERSIRVVEVTAMELQVSDDRYSLKLRLRSRYEPAQVIKLEDKAISNAAKPSGKKKP